MGYFRENIEKAVGYAPGLQPDRLDIVKLNTNENPYPPSPAVLEAIRNILPEQLRRYPQPQANNFRKAAEQVFKISAENIICTNGGDELLSIAIRAFCDRDRPLAYPVPTYSLYPVLARLHDCPTIEVAFDEKYNLPVKLAKTTAALAIVCNPNAPSGSFISPDELASLADEIKGVLLIDEAYVDFAEDNCLGLLQKFDNVIILRTLSKGYSLAGLRFGFAFAQRALIEGLLKLKDSYNVDAFANEAATAAIQDQVYFRNTVEKIKAERTRLTEQLRDLGFDVPDSQANFVLAKCNGADAQQLYEKLVKRGIYVRYFEYPRLDDKLRITVGTPEQNDKLIYALKEILSQ
jgi:histidinol-phosphate aminotransferase